MATITGTSGKDTLTGGPGDDDIYGLAGDDTLDGGLGHNVLIGGSGDDLYLVHSRNDYIYDSSGNDSAIVYVDFYKTNKYVENWTWAPGVQKLPYWIDALLPSSAPIDSGLLGAGKTFLFCFPTTAPAYFTADDAKGFQAFNAAQIAFAKQAFAYISSVIDVKFVETSDPTGANTIVMTDNQQTGSAGYAYYPWDDATASDVFLNYGGISVANLTPADGKYAALTMIHELGHALGLKHTFITADATGNTGEGPALPTAEDSTLWSVMSYNDYTASYHLKYSPFDLAALQYLYGPSTAVQTDTTFVLKSTATNMIWDGGGNDTIDGSAQTQAITLYLEPGYWGYIGQKSDLMSTAGQITVNFGTVIENAIGGSGNDVITGNAVNNTLSGGAGNDWLEGLGGNDTINGGAGVDTAAYVHAKSNYTVSVSGNAISVSDKLGTDGNDSLLNIERLQFTDVSVAYDISGIAGECYRLYQAAFDRTPDLTGLGYWIAQMDNGYALKSVAGNFVSSSEFQTLNGVNASDSVFITNIYKNVLHRTPDAGGLQFWLDSLGAGGQSRATVLVNFSESAENQAQVIGKITNGIDYAPYLLHI
ncbi:DUF4214 domain-containing protein [Undibacterium sp. RuTC16W]|uniref:DUF4214 domain-containing protein n=1 Tax=Undibacterium sp. RuTC16W TaxID=3413048 RepID=UPI003BF22CCE